MLLGRCLQRRLHVLHQCPHQVADLVRRRERKLLKVLLGVDLQRMRALRDDEGNDLLLAACAGKGRTEKLVELLLQRGFDPALENAQGESAITLATIAWALLKVSSTVR